LDFEFIFSFNLDTFGHFSVVVALVLASFIVIVLVVTVAVFTNVLASLFKSVHLVFGPCVKEVHHVDNVLRAILAGVASIVRRTKGELDQVLRVKQTVFLVVSSSLAFTGKLDNASAAIVLDGVVGDEGHVALVVIVKSTSFAEKTLAKFGVGLDFEIRDDRLGANLGNQKGKEKGSGTKEHLEQIV